MVRRRSSTQRLATLGKLAFAATVFVSTVSGWAYLKPAVLNRMELPDAIPDGDANRCALWFVGSSSIERWKTMQRDIPGWQTHNRGIGGARIAQIESRALRTASRIAPAGIIFYAGENDINAGATADRTAGVMIRLVGQMAVKWPHIPIFVIGLKPSPERWAQRPTQLRYNGLVSAFAARHRDVTYLPAGTLLLRGGVPDPTLYVDGVHLNERGYFLWSRDIARGIRQAMPAERTRHCAAPSHAAEAIAR